MMLQPRANISRAVLEYLPRPDRMPLPAQHARLNGLIDIIVDELVREIESADSEPLAQPSHDPEGEAIGRTSRTPSCGATAAFPRGSS
jgi:hypothetical protein